MHALEHIKKPLLLYLEQLICSCYKYLEQQEKLFNCNPCNKKGNTFYGIGASIRVGQEIQCLTYVGFLNHIYGIHENRHQQEKSVRPITYLDLLSSIWTHLDQFLPTFTNLDAIQTLKKKLLGPIWIY